MPKPYISIYKFKDSVANSNTGELYDVTIDRASTFAGEVISLQLLGPNGYDSGVFAPTSSTTNYPNSNYPDLSGLEAGTYTGMAITTVVHLGPSTGITEFVIGEVVETEFTSSLVDNSCSSTPYASTCQYGVTEFEHNTDNFIYELYSGSTTTPTTLVETYNGTTGNEAHVFTNLGNAYYKVVGYDVGFDYSMGAINGLGYHCDGGTSYSIPQTFGNFETDNNDSASDMLSNNGWEIRNYYTYNNFVNGATSQISGILPNGDILSGDPSVYFYAHASNPKYLGALGLSMSEGSDVGPASAFDSRDFYYNTVIKKMVMKIEAAWVTIAPKKKSSINYVWGQIFSVNEHTLYDSSPFNTVKLTTKTSGSGIITPFCACAPDGPIKCINTTCNYLNYNLSATIGTNKGGTFDVDKLQYGVMLATIDDSFGLYGEEDTFYDLSLVFKKEGGTAKMFVIFNQIQEVMQPNDGAAFPATDYNGQIIERDVTPFSDILFGGQTVRVNVVRSGANGQDFSITMGETFGVDGTITALGVSNPPIGAYDINFSLDNIGTWTDNLYLSAGDLDMFLDGSGYGFHGKDDAFISVYDVVFSGHKATDVYEFTEASGSVNPTDIEFDLRLAGSPTFSGQCSRCHTYSDSYFEDSGSNGEIFVEVFDSSNNLASDCYEVTTEGIVDPFPAPELTECGCDESKCDNSLKICISEKDVETSYIDECGIKSFKLDESGYVQVSDGLRTTFQVSQDCCTSLGYEPALVNGNWQCKWTTLILSEKPDDVDECDGLEVLTIGRNGLVTFNDDGVVKTVLQTDCCRAYGFQSVQTLSGIECYQLAYERFDSKIKL